jgi:transcriptional regulator with XRE-family HTH domain
MESLLQPWIYRLEPYPRESLSHYLGRFRVANDLTVSRLAAEAGLGGVLIKRLEYLRLNPFPTPLQLEKLASFMEISIEEILAMLPAEGVGMKLEPLRLCAACYGEQSYHRLAWQYKTTAGCDRHRLRLLSECPKCKARFPIPSNWHGKCQRCGMGYGDMQAFQKIY